MTPPVSRFPGVHHDLKHPNVHLPHSHWAETETLYVAAMYSNPCRWERRRRLFDDFRRHMASQPNVRLFVGELAYGDRPFEVTHPDNPQDFQYRTEHVLWHKENVLNAVVRNFPRNWKYGAIVDGDFTFTRHDWAFETIHLLQLFAFVQLFSTYSDLDFAHLPRGVNFSFAYNYCKGIKHGCDYQTFPWLGSPGGAWAFTHNAYQTVGGLLDTCLLGSGDYHMAMGLIGEDSKGKDIGGASEGYRHAIATWQRRATKLNRNIGYLPCHCIHNFHGNKKKRGYDWRWKILADHKFDPSTDLYQDNQGIWQLTPDKPAMRRQMLDYFLSRDEDGRD